jgi:hyperosmotically inducible periplasmic protein
VEIEVKRASAIRLILMLAFAMQAVVATAVAATTREAVRDADSRREDTLLTARVKGALITDSVTRGHDITIETFQGIIQLSGFVNSDAQRTRAAEVAAAVPGVVEVRNAIQVRQALAERGPQRRETTHDVRVVAGALQARNEHQAEQH